MTNLVFVVDDNAINRKLAIALLKRLGWGAEEFDGAEPMLDRLAAVHPESILLDISMPGISGMTACEKIRANPDWADLTVIAYTAHAMPQDRDKFLDAGFDDVLIKPINLAGLSGAVGTPDQPRTRQR